MSKAKGGLILGIVALVSAILGCVGPFGFTVSEPQLSPLPLSEFPPLKPLLLQQVLQQPHQPALLLSVYVAGN